MSRLMLQFITFAIVSLVLLKLLVWLLEAKMAFFPTRGEQITPAAHGIPYRDLAVVTADGETLHGWLLEHPDARADVIYWHGNGGNLSVWLEPLVGIHRHGVTVAALDYRGYGRSTGRPSEQGIYRDTDAWLELLRSERRDARRPVIYWGRSLGGAAAAYATTVARPDGVILESTFPSVFSLLRRDPVMSVLSRMSSYRFPTAEMIRPYRGPTLVIHGDRDEVVPYRLGVELFDGIGGDKRLLTVPGGSHNEVRPADDASYWQPILDFMDSIAVIDRPPRPDDNPPT